MSTRHPMYWRWDSMRKRCNNPANKDYAHYGAKGITLCERWAKFENFILDMGAPPSKKHTVDRIDNSKGYSPENCRWATQETQIRNQARYGKCRQGHVYEDGSFRWTHNGKARARRCLICLKNKNHPPDTRKGIEL